MEMIGTTITIDDLFLNGKDGSYYLAIQTPRKISLFTPTELEKAKDWVENNYPQKQIKIIKIYSEIQTK